ncbi:dihydrodipicolinate synthase family protein [Caldivirga sp.]|uniref:dihydrodipicolinate synthase family protein n=1 Tax=Caldivirga sp. TaxID=2080243 RepID=UPI0025C45812|nr:dihydrodipicolinate synthase family protein [Caldivirga sp.]
MEGILVALAIPFRDGKINTDNLTLHAEALIKEGVDGFFILGTTSQGVLLNIDERRLILEVLSEIKAKHLIIQVYSNDWGITRETIKLAEHYGADAVASIPPIYYKPDYSTLKLMYGKINELTSLPLYIYNIPGSTSFNITPSLVERLIKDGVKLSGIKDSSGDLAQLMEFINLSLNVFSGSDNLIVPSITVGANGVISILANSNTELVVNAYRLAKSGDLNKALNAQRVISRTMNITEAYPKPAVYHSLIKLLKYDFGGVKEPLVRNLTQDEESQLAQQLKSIGLKVIL